MENLSKQFNKHTDPNTTELTSSNQDLVGLDDHKVNVSETPVNIQEKLSDPKQKQEDIIEACFPPFAIMKTDFLEVQETDYRQKFLEDLEEYSNQERSRMDFMEYVEREYCSSQAYSSIKAKILEFEGKEREWEIHNLLEWYTNDGFLKQIITNALKIGTWDAIFSCRWILQTLKSTIKENNQKQTENFSGMLCSEVLINHSEWEKLKKGIGKHIQLYGFLSAKKTKDEVRLLNNNNDEKTVISIIVPGFPDIKDEFVELDIPKNDKQNEEMLFNIMSRFRILEAKDKNTDEYNYRHLVLLFGDEQIQKFIETDKPIIEVKIDKTKNMRCLVCASNIDITQVPVFYIDLYKTAQYICKKCIEESQKQSKSPLLCVYSLTQLLFDCSDERNLSLIIDGCTTQYQSQDQNIPFYGYDCLKCQRSDPKCFYKCLNCVKPNKSLCNECMNDKVECVEKGHLIILEGQSFTFWSNNNSEELVIFPSLFDKNQRLQRTTEPLEKFHYKPIIEGTKEMTNKSKDKIKEEDMVILYKLFNKFPKSFKDEMKKLDTYFWRNIKNKSAKLEETKDGNMIASSESRDEKEYQNIVYQNEKNLIDECFQNFDKVGGLMEKILGKDLQVCSPFNKENGYREFLEVLNLYKKEYQKETIISQSLEKIHGSFFQEIIWYNQNNNSLEILEYKNKLETAFINIKYFIDWREASKYIKEHQESMQVILSGIDQEDVIKEISGKKSISCIILFGDSIQNQQELAKKYKISCMGNNFDRLEQKIKVNLFRTDFPAFTPIFNDMHKSDINNLHLYLHAFVNFHNRRQSKRDLVTLGKQIFSHNPKLLDDIKEFERTYNQYDNETILKWY